MAKKNYKSGFAALLEPTTTETQNIKPATAAPPAEQEAGLYVNIPASLKLKFDVYCAKNSIKKNAAVAQAISNLIE